MSTSEETHIPPEKPVMKVSWQTMKENHVPLHLRDFCAHDLIPLNEYIYHLIDNYYVI